VAWLYYFVDTLFTILVFAIIGRAIMSWFRPSPGNPLVMILNEITEPVLSPIRRFMPSLGGLDLSPLIAIIALQFIRGMLLQAIVAL
jgi:YggT family protein